MVVEWFWSLLSFKTIGSLVTFTSPVTWCPNQYSCIALDQRCVLHMHICANLSKTINQKDCFCCLGIKFKLFLFQPAHYTIQSLFGQHFVFIALTKTPII